MKRATLPSPASTLAADYEALKNDLQEAREMAAALQRELADKSNEFALLRQVFEKTLQDLQTLQSGIGALRAERRQFADASMRATASEQKLATVTEERNALRITLESRDIQIHELTVKLNQAAAALTEGQREARGPKWIG